MSSGPNPMSPEVERHTYRVYGLELASSLALPFPAVDASGDEDVTIDFVDRADSIAAAPIDVSERLARIAIPGWARFEVRDGRHIRVEGIDHRDTRSRTVLARCAAGGAALSARPDDRARWHRDSRRSARTPHRPRRKRRVHAARRPPRTGLASAVRFTRGDAANTRWISRGPSGPALDQAVAGRVRTAGKRARPRRTCPCGVVVSLDSPSRRRATESSRQPDVRGRARVVASRPAW